MFHTPGGDWHAGKGGETQYIQPKYDLIFTDETSKCFTFTP